MKFLLQTARHARDLFRYHLGRAGRSSFQTDAPCFFLGAPDKHSFIGYYDITAFDKADARLIAGRCSSSHNGRAMDESLEIGYYDLQTQEFNTIGKSHAWCWQQGCRLQWIIRDDKEMLLYNTLKDGQPQTVVYDPEKREIVHSIDVHTYCVDQKYNRIATLDFNGLQRYRPGYGYDYLESAHEEKAYIAVADLEDGQSKIIARVSDVLNINPHPSMREDGALHYFNHLHWNPSGTRLMAFHIWQVGSKRYVRALTMNPDGSDIKDITGGTHVSHYWWLDDARLLFYATDPEKGMGFHIYHETEGLQKTLGRDMPDADGHPSLHPKDSAWLVSDSVVNKYFERDLWLYNLKQQKRVDLGRFLSPMKYTGEIRCDLHPRWGQTGKYVAIDTAHSYFRQIAVIDTSNLTSDKAN